MLQKPIRTWLTAIAAALSLAGPLHAQEPTAAITGVVADSAGTPTPGAVVSALSLSDGFEYRTITSRGGTYWLHGLPAGHYDISVHRVGFATATKRSAELRVGTTSTLDFALGQAAIELEALRVDQPLLETTQADVAFTIDRELIQRLPDASRQFTEIAVLAPGTTTLSNGPPGSTSDIAVGALNNQSTSILLDGGSLNEPAALLVVNGVPRLAVDQVQVLTTSYAAEYGQAASGTINATTRRGTNKWASEGFVLVRDGALSAREAFAVEDPSFSRALYGFSLGGPITHDRTHMFVAAEITDETRAGIVNTEGLYPNLDGDFDLPRNEWLLTARADHRLSPAHDLTLRYSGGVQKESQSIGPSAFCQQFGGPPIASANFGLDTESSMHSVLARHRWSVGSHALNQITVHYQRTANVWHRRTDEPALEYPSICDGGNFFDNDFDTARLEFREAFAFGAFGSTGEHQVKLGGRLTLARAEEILGTFRNGRFVIDPDHSTEPLFFERGSGLVVDETNAQVGLFVQDEWRPVPVLTLNLGLRYDVESNGTNQDFVGPGADEFAFISTVPRSIDKDNLSPRISFAVDDGGTVVRGGFGIFYDQLFLRPAGFESGAQAVRVNEPGTLDPEEVDTENGLVTNVLFPLDSVMPTPFTRQLSLGIESLLPREIVLRIDGVIIQGRNLPLTVNRSGVQGPVFQVQNSGRAESNMLMLQLRKHTAKWGANLAYTLADRKTTVDGWLSRVGVADTVNDFAGELAPTSWDERHRVILSGWMQLPNGLRAGLRSIYASSRPFSVSDANGRVGRRNSERGADFFVTDLSLSWPLPVGSMEAGVIINVYNLLNRTNFDPTTYNGRLESDSFGKPSGAFPRRRLELGVQARY